MNALRKIIFYQQYIIYISVWIFKKDNSVVICKINEIFYEMRCLVVKYFYNIQFTCFLVIQDNFADFCMICICSSHFIYIPQIYWWVIVFHEEMKELSKLPIISHYGKLEMNERGPEYQHEWYKQDFLYQVEQWMK